MSEHTPGPWAVVEETFGYDTTGTGQATTKIRAEDGSLICQVAAGMNRHNPGKRDKEANARLIAAAPELLEALVLAAERCHNSDNVKEPRFTTSTSGRLP